MAEFLHMGGHGFFVWTSYFVALAVLCYQFISPVIKRKKITAQLAAMYKSEKK